MTTPGWQLDEDRASEADILDHLKLCDARFNPPLSSRVDLPAYANRLHNRARRFEAWANGELIGLIAAYLEGKDGAAFISSVSVDERFLRFGIASVLLTRVIECASVAGLAKIRLQVGAANNVARRFYEKRDFHTCLIDGEQIWMELQLPGNAR